MFRKYVLLGLCLAGSALFAQPSARVDSGACRPARRFRSPALRRASGASKSRGRRLRAFYSRNPRSWKSFARKTTYASSRPDTRRSEGGGRNRCPGRNRVRRERRLPRERPMEPQRSGRFGAQEGGSHRQRAGRLRLVGGVHRRPCRRAGTTCSYLAPGALYGDPDLRRRPSPGGTLNDAARRFVMREDVLPAPLFALSFGNGASIAVLDPRRAATRPSRNRSSPRR